MSLLGLMRRELRAESRKWVADGDISADQADRILARYGTALEDDSDRSLAYRILVSVALLFVGVALLLVVAANWEQWPRALRMLTLIATTITLNSVGIRQQLRRGSGQGWLFLGGISFGASIMLIAQIYHLGEHFPDGLLAWALGVAPMAWLTRSRLLTLLMLAVAFVWQISEGHFAPPWLMPVFLLVAVQVSRRAGSAALLLVTVLVALVWLNLMLAWSYHQRPFYSFQAGHLSFNLGLLALCYSISQALLASHEPFRQRAGALLSRWTLRGYLLALLLLSFSAVMRSFLDHHWGMADPGLWLGLVAALGALLWALLSRLGSTAGRALLVALPVLLLLWHSVVPSYQASAWAVGVNLLALISAIVLIQHGLRAGLGQSFYSGVGLLLVLALLRYLDVFGDYLGAAAMFAVAALVLFAAARYWRAQQGGVS
ncbi:MAG: DUF2157 domain-containing protein [Alcanivorax sp.]|nr:DUF2157 domain-containing protein [Alcanivorax sp.]